MRIKVWYGMLDLFGGTPLLDLWAEKSHVEVIPTASFRL